MKPSLLFPSTPDKARGILVIGATGHVGFGKLCQLAQRLCVKQLEVPLIALDPSPKCKDLSTKVVARLSKTCKPEQIAHLDRILQVIQGTPKDLPPQTRIGWALEAIPEKLELKHQAYQELFSTLVDPPLLSSTTSAYTTKALFSGLPHAKRCSVLHPFFPHHKNPLWEMVSKGAVTAPAHLDELRDLMGDFGFELIEVADVPAFAADRIFCGLMLEAVRTAQELGLPAHGVDLVYADLLGCTPFKVHNMIPGSNALSMHCMQLCAQEHASSLFAIPDSWVPYASDPGLQWPYHTQSLSPEQAQAVKARAVGMLACICAYLLQHKVVSPTDLDKLCTQALAFRVGPCALFEEMGIPELQQIAQSYLAKGQVSMASTVAPLEALASLGLNKN